MFPFNLLSVLRQERKQANKNNDFDPGYEPPSPHEIRKIIEKMKKCDNCHFIVFENYWGSGIEENIKLCPTCGFKLN